MGSLGVVLPTYRPRTDALVEYVHAIHDELAPDVVRVQADAASEEVLSALASFPVAVDAVPYRRGKGAAITKGFESIHTDVLAFADADGSTPASSLADVISPVASGTVDLAVGSRRHPHSTVASHQTLARRLMGDGFAWLARRLLAVPLHDYQCGAKAISAEGWATVRDHLYEPGFAWDVELVAMAGALDLAVGEVPIEWHDRPGSTVSPVGDAARLGQALLRSRHRAKRLRNDRLHTAVAARDDSTALVDRCR